MWRTAREASALAGDVEEGEEMWPVRSGGAAHRRRDRKRAILGLAVSVSWFCLSWKALEAGPVKKNSNWAKLFGR